jgi:hypothetical protein
MALDNTIAGGDLGAVGGDDIGLEFLALVERSFTKFVVCGITA